MTLPELAKNLNATRILETEQDIANKISRRRFSRAFLIQCLTAIGATPLRLEECSPRSYWSA
ncbi:DUF6471 domain-containing protein, partial [Phenylobacterium sp.]|uniref:DUF6471 domain-containing protein n=1 Tax=Phenylobacterium sp. TaxID=1871053 RepID=UPI0038621571